MRSEDRTYYFIITGYNALPYYRRCIKSCLEQNTDRKFKVIVYSDGSTDGSREFIPIEFNHFKNIRVYGASDNRGACYSRNYVLSRIDCNPDDVAILVGLDDAVFPNLVETIAKEYDTGAELTYGNWINQHGEKNDLKVYPKYIHDHKAYRAHEFITTAPNTFTIDLYRRINKNLLKLKNAWLQNCTDVAIMWALLEQTTPDKIRPIETITYMYNQGLPNNTVNRFGRFDKERILRHLKSFFKYESI